MTLIKICGITNLDDALVAVGAGADALGFNFYPPSSRYIEPDAARRIIEQLPDTILPVGVFVNESSQSVKAIAQDVGLRALQLHGDELPDYCNQLNDWFVIKTFAVKEGFDETATSRYEVNAIMLDASHKELKGGTGQVIDWSIARRIRDQGKPMFLAGGLSPENVANAIKTVEPYAVDSCSALESAPGRKDHDRVKAFVKVVRRLTL
jgi:phosphoribosylanthranilate isomerase